MLKVGEVRSAGRCSIGEVRSAGRCSKGIPRMLQTGDCTYVLRHGFLSLTGLGTLV